MYEVEVKVAADLDRVRGLLRAIGVEELGTVVQEDTYYDAPHRSFAATDEALRIRSQDDGTQSATRVTYKGPLVDDESKTREEVEVEVMDPKRMDDILRNLGFEPTATVRKERERYAFEGYTITLDDVDHVGEFVEVETAVTDTDDNGGTVDDEPETTLETARDGAYDVLARLGLDPDDQLRTSYLEMLLEAEPSTE